MKRKKPKQGRRPEQVSAMWQQEEQIMPQVLLGSRVTPLLHVPVWIMGPAMFGSEEPKSAAG